MRVWDDQKIEICEERVILAYADDIVVMEKTRDKVENTCLNSKKKKK